MAANLAPCRPRPVVYGSGCYRRLMSARADLAELAQQQLELVDELGRSLLEPYPRNRPLPPASRFGRRPKRYKSGNGG